MRSFKEFSESTILDAEYSKTSISSLLSTNQTTSSLALTQAPEHKPGFFSKYKKGPCSIVAVAAILEVEPEYLWNNLKFKNVWSGSGVDLQKMVEFMIPHTSEIIQGDFMRNFKQEDNFTGAEVLNIFEKNNIMGKWLLSMSGNGTVGHVMAIVNGVIHDTCLPCTKKGYLKLDFKIR